MLEVLKEEKSIAQIAAENGVHPNQIHKWKKQALENFSQLFEDEQQNEKVREAEHEKQLNNLYAEIGRLSAQLSWRKKNLACTRRAERVAMLEKGHPELSLKVQAELLGISYSSLFYKPVLPSERELAIKHRIDELYTEHPYYGSRKITQELRPEFSVARSTIQRYMREMGIFALVPGPLRVNQRPSTRSFRTCCGVSRRSIPTIFGALILRTSAWLMAGSP